MVTVDWVICPTWPRFVCVIISCNSHASMVIYLLIYIARVLDASYNLVYRQIRTSANTCIWQSRCIYLKHYLIWGFEYTPILWQVCGIRDVYKSLVVYILLPHLPGTKKNSHSSGQMLITASASQKFPLIDNQFCTAIFDKPCEIEAWYLGILRCVRESIVS